MMFFTDEYKQQLDRAWLIIEGFDKACNENGFTLPEKVEEGYQSEYGWIDFEMFGRLLHDAGEKTISTGAPVSDFAYSNAQRASHLWHHVVREDGDLTRGNVVVFRIRDRNGRVRFDKSDSLWEETRNYVD